MSILTTASAQSVWRGYVYYTENKVLQLSGEGETLYSGVVAGSGGSRYPVTIDTAHPLKSQCTCPLAAGRRIVCKHKVALYFAAFPQEAEQYIAEVEAAEAEAEAEAEQTERLVRQTVAAMRRSQLQEVLLQVLFDGPEWQYDEFIERYVRR